MPYFAAMGAENRTPAVQHGLRWIALVLVVVSVGALVLTRDFEVVPAGADEPPSIILVLVDTLRADYLGAYGFDGDISPHLDRFAQGAVVFENAFSQAPWTKPSIASLFTSLHPEQHGVVAHGRRYGSPEELNPSASALPQRAVTLAERLRAAGYATAAFVANPWIQKQLGFAQGFDVFDAEDVGNAVPATRLFERARAWLAQRDRSRPYFLYLHLMDVHGPYDAPLADFEAVRGSPGLGEARSLSEGEMARRRAYLMRGNSPRGDASTLDGWRASYAAGVRSLDRQLGGFLETLSRDGELDDALFVVTSDHGEELADHGSWDHGDSLYEEQIRVPLIVRLPGGRQRGRRVERIVSLIDLMPTLLEIAGSRVPRRLAGTDLGPLLAGKSIDGPAVAYSSGVKWQPGLESVRTRDRKLIREAKTGASEVFDLEKDPAEKHAQSGPPPAELELLLERHVRTLDEGPAFRSHAHAMAPGTREKLRALGYLDDEPTSGAHQSGRRAQENPS